MNKFVFFLFLAYASGFCWAQNYDYSYLGDTSSYDSSPSFGVCMMGGATENDAGSEWFLNRADGGNVLVLRASGTDAYNDYFYNQLNSNIQSVETIIFQSSAASTNPFILSRIEAAEAIWIAGGDQSIYENYWKSTPVANRINAHVNIKKRPIGGTSAGMAVLSEQYFSASNGTISSATALSDPTHPAITINSQFLKVPYLENTITDTHYDNPDRKGRHAVFLAHLLIENDTMQYGIAAEEFVAICIDETGVARIFGDHPTYEDYAWFLRVNCELIPPNTISAGNPLQWSPDKRAIQACKIAGTSNGNQRFDLITWENIQGGQWEDWNIDAGNLTTESSNRVNCSLLASSIEKSETLNVRIDKELQQIIIQHQDPSVSVYINNSLGQLVHTSNNLQPITTRSWPPGVYQVRVITKQGIFHECVTL